MRCNDVHFGEMGGRKGLNKIEAQRLKGRSQGNTEGGGEVDGSVWDNRFWSLISCLAYLNILYFFKT